MLNCDCWMLANFKSLDLCEIYASTNAIVHQLCMQAYPYLHIRNKEFPWGMSWKYYNCLERIPIFIKNIQTFNAWCCELDCFFFLIYVVYCVCIKLSVHDMMNVVSGLYNYVIIFNYTYWNGGVGVNFLELDIFMKLWLTW